MNEFAQHNPKGLSENDKAMLGLNLTEKTSGSEIEGPKAESAIERAKKWLNDRLLQVRGLLLNADPNTLAAFIIIKNQIERLLSSPVNPINLGASLLIIGLQIVRIAESLGQ